MTNITEQARQLFSGLTGKDLKQELRNTVTALWPDLPRWSTLDHPVIEETQKSSNGCGVVLTFEDQGERYVVLGQAGAHYYHQKTEWVTAFTIPGGFINLSRTPGSLLVPASDQPESPRITAARETEEEMRKDDGAPLFAIDPARLKPMDTAMAGPNVMTGLMMEMTEEEVQAAKEHVRRLGADAAYKDAVALRSANEESGLPEIEDVKIFKLADVAAGHINLLHKDQQSLFLRVEEHFAFIQQIRQTAVYNGRAYVPA